jgi:Rrf2 family protein
MKASVKSDYACRAVEALALHHPDTRPMRIEEIARKEAIPSNYLVQILIELKSKGLIQSRRGKAGGYNLAKAPREITVGDVLRAIQGDILEMPLLAESRCPEEIKRAWRRIKTAAEGTADGITFEEICSEATTGKTQMYYI